MSAKLKAVPAPADEPPPSTDYEWQERQRIARKDWAAIHVRSDRSPALDFIRRVVRGWRG